VAFAFAPAAILAPLESLQFVSNLLFATFVNKVNVTRRQFFGCCGVISGSSLAVGLGPNAVFTFTIPKLVDFWTSPTWNAYLILVMCLAIIAQGTNMRYKRLLAQGQHPPYANKVLPLTFAMSSALIGTQSVVQAKCLSEVVEQLGCGINIFSYYYTYISIVLFLTQVAVWLYRLTLALSYFDPLFIIPLLQSNYILFATISGGIYFQEFNTMVGYQWAGFATGIVIMFCGLYFLAPMSDDDGSEEDPKAGDMVAFDADPAPPATPADDLSSSTSTDNTTPLAQVASEVRHASFGRLEGCSVGERSSADAAPTRERKKSSASFPVAEIHNRLSRAALNSDDATPTDLATTLAAAITGVPFSPRVTVVEGDGDGGTRSRDNSLARRRARSVSGSSSAAMRSLGEVGLPGHLPGDVGCSSCSVGHVSATAESSRHDSQASCHGSTPSSSKRRASAL